MDCDRDQCASWASTLVESDSFDVLGLEEVRTSSGDVGFLLHYAWLSGSDRQYDIHHLELWTEGRWGPVSISLSDFRDDFLLMYDLFDLTARSLCAD